MYIQPCKAKDTARNSGNYCSKECRIEHTRLKGPGGRYKTSQGYISVYHPTHPDASKTNFILEHRLVAEEKYGRRLLKTEHVHHINGIKDDNRPENLEILSAGVHAKITGQTALQKRKSMRQEFNEMKAELHRYRELYGPLPD